MNEIKVGSEWVSDDCKKTKCKVLHVGKTVIFAEWEDGREEGYPKSQFLNYYKPAPVRRTVWLNVYENRVHAHFRKDIADQYMMLGLLYQQEVELIDPREGGEK